MSGDERSDFDREQRVGQVLRRPVRDVLVAPFTAVEARLARGRSPVLAALAGAAVIVLALVLGNALAERRANVAVPGSPTVTPAATMTVAPSATAPSATTAPAPSATPTPTASGTPIPLPNTARIAAAGNGVVWALVADTHLFVSSDRGETWTERSMSTPEGQIGPDISVAFVDALHGWAMRAGSPATQCQAQGVTLWASSDGARTWQTVLDLTLGSGTRAVGGINAFQCKENLAFVDTRRGFLTAWDPNGPPTIYQTTDGGTTWTGARLPDPPGFTSNGAGFTLRAGPVADFGTALYVAATGNVGGAMASYAFRSTDAGATWTYATQLPGENVVFLTPTHWIQLAPPNDSKETTDAGASWHAFATDYTQAAPIAPQVVFGDSRTGYATVRGQIQRTTDGGAHWTTIKTPGT